MFTTSPHSILFQLGPLTIHWYGLLVVGGFLAGLVVLIYLFKRYGLKTDEAYNLFFYCIIFGLIGARLYYVLYAWNYYGAHPIDIVKIWQGGLAIHGAIIAAILTIYFYSKKRALSPWLLIDLVATCLPLSLAIGRWGNYFNQELFGLPTNLPWGIQIDLVHRPAGYSNFIYFHPTFLYESILDLILFLILFWWQRKRCSQFAVRGSQLAAEGNLTLLFLFGYSAIRFAMEFLRTDYSPMVWGIRWAQLLSGLVMAGVLIFWLIKKKQEARIKN